jgi:aminoglycoside phosphotransferase (APT) family kinase protein
VLSHNDTNPTNLVYDGERLMMLDWQTAALNDKYYDLATIALFLRMDDNASRALLSAYEDRSISVIPARFAYDRRAAAIISASASLYIAYQRGHRSADAVTAANAPSLGDVYADLQGGTLTLSSPAGQWRFGLALIKESLAPA